MAVAAFHKNGDSHDTPQLEPGVLKILLVGKQRCGKSSFIRTFIKDNMAALPYPDTGSNVSLYDYYQFGVLRRFAFVEVPGVNEDGLDRAINSHMDAKGAILMFAIDDPLSYHELRNKWYPALNFFVHKRFPMIAVGCKVDLRENPRVNQRLALTNQTPITFEEGRSLMELEQILKYFECSQNDLPSVNSACSFILTHTYDDANP